MQIEDLEIDKLAEARLERAPKQIPAELQISQGFDPADWLQAIVGKTIGRLRLSQQKRTTILVELDTYEVKGRQQSKAPQSRGQTDQHVAMQIECL